MTVNRNGFLSVIERFPQQKDAVKRLFRESESFQDMCEDYMRCTEALRHWNQVELTEAPGRRKEYAALLEDLEAQISQALNELQEQGQ